MNLLSLLSRNACKFLLIALLFFIPDILQSQIPFLENGNSSTIARDGGMFGNSSTRKITDLAGTWEYSLDEKKTWYSVKIPSSYSEARKIWFRRKFSVNQNVIDNYVGSLQCLGVNYFCEITINDNFIGRHIGGSTSFSFPIEKNVLQLGSENSIVIYVDNELNARNTVPLRQQIGGWRNYGGIIRDIFLSYTPQLFIDDVHLESKFSPTMESVGLNITSVLSNKGLKQAQWESQNARKLSLAVQTEIYEQATGILVSKLLSPISLPEENHILEVEQHAVISAPKLWSPEFPELYNIKCNIVVLPVENLILIDEVSEEYGFRDVKLSANQFFINGSPYLLKGIAWQEDHSKYGASLTLEAMERDIALMKNAGVNLIRIVNRPTHPYFLTLCDRYGVFVFEEIPMMQVPQEIFEKDDFSATVDAIVKEMVIRDDNHPCVLAWGIGDDFEMSEQPSTDFVRSLKTTVRSLDNRPVYFITSRIKDNLCLNEIDFVAINALGLESRNLKNSMNEWKSLITNKPLVIASYGKEVEPGNRHGSSDPYSYEAQARGLQQFVDGVKESGFAGGVIWTFNDWRGDRPSLSVHSKDPYLSTYGIVNEYREKRTSYTIVKNLYSGEKVSALPIGNYAFTEPMIYVVAGFILIIVGAFLYNRDRRFRDNVNRSLFRTYNFYADIRDQRIISVFQTIIVTLIVSVTFAVILSSLLFHFRDSKFIDVAFTHLLISDVLKENFVFTVWKPIAAIFWLALAFFGIMLCIAVLVKFFSLFIRSRVLFLHAYEVVIWSMLPFTFFIPLGMILYRILETPSYVYPILILIAITIVWITQRLLKGIAVVYEMFPSRVYFFGTILLIFSLIAVYGYYDYTQSASAYLRYMFSLTQSLHQ